MKTLTFIGFFFCFAAIFQTVSAQHALVKGQLVENESCSNQTSWTYAYYLPSTYSSVKKYPIVFSFDPGARGKLTVEIYQKIAENYGFILIGSNNSKNGSLTDNYNIASALFDDAFAKFSIDESRVYLLGMSGGSRLASGIAANSTGITGVIGCAAGFLESIGLFDKLKFSYVGIVGMRDMNFTEMVMLDEKMDASPVQHQFIYHSGLHDWPPESDFEEAILWMNVFAMQRNILKPDTLQIQQLAKRYESVLNDSANPDLLTRHAVYKSLENCWSGIVQTDPYRDAINALEKDPEYISLATKHRQILEAEVLSCRNLLDELDAFVNSRENSRSYDWWKLKIASIQAVEKHDDTEQQYSGYRILETIFFWAREEYVKNKIRVDPTVAINSLLICTLIQPAEYWPDYLLAALYAKADQKNKALSSLETAAKKGFSDAEQLKAEPAFIPLHKNKRFQELLNTMGNKSKNSN
jgi:hypothetical protein